MQTYPVPPYCKVCPRSSDPFYVVTYYIKWVTTFWTHRTHCHIRKQYIYSIEKSSFAVLKGPEGLEGMQVQIHKPIDFIIPDPGSTLDMNSDPDTKFKFMWTKLICLSELKNIMIYNILFH